MIDSEHWKKLRGLDPQDVTRRSLAAWDESAGAFRLTLLSDVVEVRPEQESVAWPEVERKTGRKPGFHQWLVAVVYLLSAKDKEPSGEWVQAASLPYGEFFFRGPHALPTEALAETFGDHPKAFTRAAKRVDGEPWETAQGAYVLPALPRVPILVQLWERDDEFPARANFLFDRDTCEHLPVDAIFSLTIVAAKRLVLACPTEKGPDRSGG